jgi:predicted GIY-YIG superfamily endonuclease
MPAEKTSLYRLFNEADELLYVGISHDPDNRWSQHQSLTPWIREVATRTIEWHGSRDDALAAEARTIVEL